jgi:predicted ATPase
VQAELLLTGSTPDFIAAEASYREAIHASREMNAHLPELRATTGLAQVWQQQGRTDEALQLVSDCLDWFSEGFEAPDLIEAKTLVEDLNSSVEVDSA